MVKFFFLCLLLGLCQARTSPELKVRVEDGKVVGRYLTSESGKTIRAFMGIPYAEPPVGKLRFKAPEKVKKWPGVLLAHHEPPKCTQFDPFSRSLEVEGQEDCLYLNVYAPQVFTQMVVTVRKLRRMNQRIYVIQNKCDVFSVMSKSQK